ncbi:transferase [Pandoraea captiosa]|uniref:Transferase n=1 Tax=Pandoraea captiosa TaxID=2508302 RepID=A0A5E5AQL9_9BURK|nr:acyltransferase [Pandoraea captiosa]VVE74380.1 transferase [Pandoraea captiosa]
MPVPREAVVWAYRFFLGRDPESENAIIGKMKLEDEVRLMQEFTNSREFKAKRRDLVVFGNFEADRKEKLSAPAGMKTIRIREMPASSLRNGAERISGTITFPLADEEKLKDVIFSFHGPKEAESLTGVEIVLKSVPALYLAISDSEQKVTVGEKCSGRWIFHLWGPAIVQIGDRVTSNGTDCFINPGGSMLVGDDCMFANAFVHVGDNHAIIDAVSGAPLNYSPNARIEFKKHVWVASRATILADTTIGAGCVIGAGSIVKGNFDDKSLIVGVPAKVVRTGVSWTRSYEGRGAEDVLEMLNT